MDEHLLVHFILKLCTVWTIRTDVRIFLSVLVAFVFTAKQSLGAWCQEWMAETTDVLWLQEVSAECAVLALLLTFHVFIHLVVLVRRIIAMAMRAFSLVAACFGMFHAEICACINLST